MSAEYIVQYYSAKGGTRVRISHENGEVLLVAPQAYSRKIDVETMMNNLFKAIAANRIEYVHSTKAAKTVSAARKAITGK